MNEKEAIEKATADAFIELYNRNVGTSYSIVEYSDAPDIQCKDLEGKTFNFEITLTEDRPNDIQAAIGRSSNRSIEVFRQHCVDVRAGRADPLERVSCLQGNVVNMIADRIRRKLQRDYGHSVALVIRDSSPLCWNWDLVVDQLKGMLDLQRNPFDKGIWIMSFPKDRVFRIV